MGYAKQRKITITRRKANGNSKEQEKLEEENVNKLDFTKFELDYILQNANFNDIQLRIFNRLTDKFGRQKIVKIAIEENISERTVSRIIKQIKNKIKRLL